MGPADSAVLQFIGAFAQAQDLMEVVIRARIKTALPALGPLIDKRLRLSDEERLKMFHAVAKESEYVGDLSHFDAVHDRIKTTRDRIAHSGLIPRSDGTGYIMSATPSERTARAAKGTGPIPPLLPEDILRLLNQAVWLRSHAIRLANDTGAGWTQIKTETGLEAYEPPVPPAEPPG